MAEQTDKTKELYENIEAILQKEKADTPAKDEEKAAVLAQLNEMANSSMDFDPDRLESIEAFAASFENNANAEAILKKVAEQKAKTGENIQTNDDRKTSVQDEKQTPAPNRNQPQPAGRIALAEQNIDPANVPSYTLYKYYTAIKNKENQTEEEKKYLSNVDKFAEAILNNTDPKNIDTDGAVGLQDYLAIMYEAHPDDKTKEQYAELQDAIDEKLKQYDAENGLENAARQTPEQIRENEYAWAKVGADTKPIMSELSSIMSNLTKEEQLDILKDLHQMAIFDLKDHAPDENGAKVMQNAVESNAAEFKALVIAEYLKQQAKAEFCEQNKIKPEELETLLLKNAKGEELSEEEKGVLEKLNKHTSNLFQKSQDFNGPFTNKEFLKNAVAASRSQINIRSVTKECRRSRLMNAEQISKNVEKMNNKFAEKHPKLYKAMNIAKTIGINAARTAAISAAFGPVGLTAYSAFKTGKTIRKAYLEYREKEGLDSFSFKNIKSSLKNYASFAKYLKQPENRAQALTLAGQVASTAISGYFSLGGGLGNIVGNSGIAGHLVSEHAGFGAEHIANAAKETAKSGFLGNMSTKTIARLTSSTGIGFVKYLSEKHNLKSAHKKLTKILEANGVKVSDNMLKELDAASANPQEFTAKLKELTPNIDEKQADEAFKNAELARKSNPKSAAIGTIAGAALGFGAAAGAEYLHDMMNDGNASETAVPAAAKTGLTTEDKTAESQFDKSTEDLAHQAVEKDWSNGSAQRLESFGIDAKNANEMLREMKIIDKDDHHFYRQHELAKLVDNAKLNDEQRTQIQNWANDREARVHNLKVWQAEHSYHSGGHRAVATNSTESDVENKATAEENTVADGKASEEQIAEEQITEETVAKQKYHVQGRIDKLKGLKGDVEAEDALHAAGAFAASNNMAHHSKLTVENTETGERSEIASKIKSHSNNTKITNYDKEGNKLSTEKRKVYTDDTSKAAKGTVKTTEYKDLDGDGKKDKIVTTKSADGNTVSYTKYSKSGDRVLTNTDTQGKTTTVSANEKAEKDGTSKSSARSALKNTYNKLSKIYKGRD